MKPTFTLEYFCCFFTETWWGVLMHKKMEAEEKGVKKEKRMLEHDRQDAFANGALDDGDAKSKEIMEKEFSNFKAYRRYQN